MALSTPQPLTGTEHCQIIYILAFLLIQLGKKNHLPNSFIGFSKITKLIMTRRLSCKKQKVFKLLLPCSG